MEKFQENLTMIREKEYERKQDLKFNQWQMDYEEHLLELYRMTCQYYTVIYDDFVRATYKTYMV